MKNNLFKAEDKKEYIRHLCNYGLDNLKADKSFSRRRILENRKKKLLLSELQIDKRKPFDRDAKKKRMLSYAEKFKTQVLTWSNSTTLKVKQVYIFDKKVL